MLHCDYLLDRAHTAYALVLKPVCNAAVTFTGHLWWHLVGLELPSPSGITTDGKPGVYPGVWITLPSVPLSGVICKFRTVRHVRYNRPHLLQRILWCERRY
jgi:hypothetical protein